MKIHLLVWFAAAQAALAQSGPLVTITNPTPLLFQGFGTSVTALGNDRVIVAAPYDSFTANLKLGGAVFLFDTNGTLLTTLTNPAPTPSGFFGAAIFAFGSDRVVIGAPFDNPSGGFLFSTNGTLVQTFSTYGVDGVTVVGDKVLIASSWDSSTAGGDYAGAAYLFTTNGSLLTMFTNPVSEIQPHFGDNVAAVGDDRMLITSIKGALGGGAVYLFSTNGSQLTTFTNPTPSPYDYFGRSIAAAHDRILIGNSAEDTGRGVAYLFSTNGTLLNTFTNPTPATNEGFGVALALTDDRVIISASGDRQNAGAVYVYSTNGTLLTTWTNPVPAQYSFFGKAIAILGHDRVIISADLATFIYALPDTRIPSLTVSLSPPSQATISWAPNVPGFVLQETLDVSTSNWVNSASGATNPAIVPVSLPSKFYRLFKP